MTNSNDKMQALPKGILFDLDDTIIAYDAVAAKAWRVACGEYAGGSGRVDTAALLDAIERVGNWYYSDAARCKQARMNLRAARREIVCLALDRIGVNDPALGCRIADVYSARRDEFITLFPGAEQALSVLREQGVAMALLTNGEAASQRAKIGRFGLERFFDVTLVEGELGMGKPDPAVYQRALAGLGLKAADAWMVGDNLEWDVAAPQRLGIRGIWNDYRRAGLPPDCPVRPDRIVHSIAELAGVPVAAGAQGGGA